LDAAAGEPHLLPLRIHRDLLPHAGKAVEVTVQTDTYQVTVEDGITVAASRKTSRDIKRHKASDYGQPTEIALIPSRPPRATR
jgi:hypothetical protein